MSVPDAKSRIGVSGLAVMGANLARNIARRGTPVAVHNRTAARTREFMEAYGSEGTFTPAETIEDFVAALERPRRIIVMAVSYTHLTLPTKWMPCSRRSRSRRRVSAKCALPPSMIMSPGSRSGANSWITASTGAPAFTITMIRRGRSRAATKSSIVSAAVNVPSEP